MPIISTIDPQQASGEVADLYRGVQQQMGMIPHALSLLSASPHRLRTQIGELGYYFTHASIGPALGAAIRLCVAVQTRCEYCVQVNSGMLARGGMPAPGIESLKHDPASAPLPKKDLAMLLLVLKSVQRAHEVSAGDIAEVRALGWSDRDIVDAVWQGALSAAMDTMMNAFKVELESAPRAP